MKVVLFGDSYGIPILLKSLADQADIVCIVAASIRPADQKVVDEYAKEAGVLSLIQPSKRDTQYGAFVKRLQALEANYFFTYSYSMKLQPDILMLPSELAINVHEALLPQYRGPNPLQWAILNEERATGLSVHVMESEIDTGAIIAQEKVPIFFSDSWIEVRERIKDVSRNWLPQVIAEIFDRKRKPVSQNEELSHTYRRRCPEDGIFNWSDSVRSIYNLNRALIAPLPGIMERDGEFRSSEMLSVQDLLVLKQTKLGGLFTDKSGTIAFYTARPFGNTTCLHCGFHHLSEQNCTSLNFTFEALEEDPTLFVMDKINWDNRTARITGSARHWDLWNAYHYLLR